MHQRQAIRDNILATLLTPAGDPPAYPIPEVGGRVYPWRAINVGPDKLPCVLIYAKQDTVTESDPPYVRHELEVIVEIMAASGAGTFDDIDDICYAVEALLAIDQKRGGYAQTTDLRDTVIGHDGDGDRILGVATLTYVCPYAWDWIDLGTVEDWLRLRAGYDAGMLSAILVGGTDALVSGQGYYLLTGTLGSTTGGPFVASAGDVSAFASAGQTVRPALAQDWVVMPT